MVATHKGNDDVEPMFKEAKQVAGKVPTTLISDKAANFHNAWKQQYKAKNFLHKDTEHIHDVALTAYIITTRWSSLMAPHYGTVKK